MHIHACIHSYLNILHSYIHICIWCSIYIYMLDEIFFFPRFRIQHMIFCNVSCIFQAFVLLGFHLYDFSLAMICFYCKIMFSFSPLLYGKWYCIFGLDLLNYQYELVCGREIETVDIFFSNNTLDWFCCFRIGDLVRSTIMRLLYASCPSCPSHWILICRNVVSPFSSPHIALFLNAVY